MKNLKLKSLAAVAVLLSATSASAVQLVLINDSIRTNPSTQDPTNLGGAVSNKSILVQTGTWNWDGAILTQNGTVTSRVNAGGPGNSILSDNITNIVIDTTALTTTGDYTCTEGNFLAGVGSHGCTNTSFGANFVYESSVAYNVGGDGNCINRTLGGDDVNQGTGAVRGLGTSSGGSCDPTAGAYKQWFISSDTTGVGGLLTLWNGVGPASCGSTTTKDAACVGSTKLVLSAAVPVPAAVWLLGSGLGLLGLARRRIGASA